MNGKAGKYGSYHRIHKAAHPSDLETGKIHRETARSVKGRRAADSVSREMIANPEDDAMLDEYQEHLVSAERDRRNAKGHKRRLKKLREDKDFV